MYSMGNRNVFFPLARESLCRFVVEAKCLGLNVITSQNYGASLSFWFGLDRANLIDFLRNTSTRNLNQLKSLL